MDRIFWFRICIYFLAKYVQRKFKGKMMKQSRGRILVKKRGFPVRGHLVTIIFYKKGVKLCAKHRLGLFRQLTKVSSSTPKISFNVSLT